MFNIVFSDEYTVAPALLVRLRNRAGRSQRDLAAALGRSQSHIYKLETGQRPIEIVEFCRFACAVGVDPNVAFRMLLREWDQKGCGYKLTGALNQIEEVEA
jgi:transcriptional regulator with XRE-family HTH domain